MAGGQGDAVNRAVMALSTSADSWHEKKAVFPSFSRRRGICGTFIRPMGSSLLLGKWLDLVMHAKWTGNPEGFLKF